MLQHLHNQSSGWYDILSLFGLVFELFELEKQQEQPHIWAGRLRLTTRLGSPSDSKIDGKPYHDGGPPDLKRHITVRNPLDRVTSAAKEGGLHFTLEMSEEEAFQIGFEILNPKHTDLTLIEAWREDIDDGFLRFGALTSQGRGRVTIESEEYTLYLRTQHRLAAKLDELDDTLFQGIWKGKENMTFEQLQENFGAEL